MRHHKLTQAERNAYRQLYEAARRLKRAQQRAARRRAMKKQDQRAKGVDHVE
jgi:hypothetical protein